MAPRTTGRDRRAGTAPAPATGPVTPTGPATPTGLAALRQRIGPPARTGLPIGAAARRLGTTPRMLRYREAVGLLGPARRSGAHRRYRDRDLLRAGYSADLEARYGVTPATLAFALRALGDERLAADLRRLAELSGEPPRAISALDFEAAKARRLLHLS